ncbi:hypothetical protein [Actinoplanes friuliensis]|uniref:Uncharacterized protein n=1 Tax=Actinoplanes friuliensis DSM 7358 TaxID=1246995 RepID=U5WC41_9ACTN|nr:hypothetical protein [Actinoplanes friuliensis]AGZ46709.1 hypothetical protein AFR_42275 [Actinoplanes friuliensis DSM 7358]
MTHDLELRYSRLLHLYPSEYRRARGAEILDTLLSSAEEGRAHPAPRELFALVLGALRVRAGRGSHRSVRQSWLAACRAAALMLLVYAVADTTMHLAITLAYRIRPAALILAALAVALYAMIAALRGRYRTAGLFAAVAFLVALAEIPNLIHFWQLPLAVVLLVPLMKLRPPPVVGLLRYAPVVPVLLVVIEQGLAQLLPDIAGILRFGAFLGLAVGGLIWLAVDERVAMALGLLLLNGALIQLVFIPMELPLQNIPAALASVAVAASVPVVLLLASAGAARRHARL